MSRVRNTAYDTDLRTRQIRKKKVEKKKERKRNSPVVRQDSIR